MTEIYVYWISTSLLLLLYLASALLYIFKSDWVKKTLAGFGYPAYLVALLAMVKMLAVIAVLARPSVALSDLAYAGMLFHLLLSALAHIGVRKPSGALPALLGLVLLSASFATQNMARDVHSPYSVINAAQAATLN